MVEQLKIFSLIAGGAAIIPLVSRRLRLPSSALEIVFGIILFGVFKTEKMPWFILLKEIGFIYLMFIAGMELDLSKLLKSGRFVWYVFLPLFSLILMPLIFQLLGMSFFLGIVVSVLSAGIIIPVLKEGHLLETSFGKDAVGIALIGELICIALLTFMEIYVHYGFTLSAVLHGFKLLGLLLLVTIILKMIYYIAWRHPKWVKMIMESEDPVEEGIRVVVFAAIAGATVALMSGVEAILGSFMAGLVIGQVFKSKGFFEDKINSLGFGFLIPFFFIGLGADFDISLFKSLDNLRLALFLTFMLFSSKALIFIFYNRMKLKSIEALSLSIILSAPLSMLVVSGAIGKKINLIDDAQNSSLILTALITSILFPSLFKMLIPRIKKD